MNPIYYEVNERGELVGFDTVVEELPKRPGVYRAHIHREDVRTTAQNRYYWGVVLLMCRNAIRETEGDESIDSAQVHEFFKLKYHFREIVDYETGEVSRVAITTTFDDPVEFMEYIEKIRDFAAKYLNISIPDPSPIN